MDNFNYQLYLRSPAWKEKARKRAEIDGYRCCMCGCGGTKNNPLESHHLNYKNIYHEDVYRDLLTLCHCCHSSVHKMMNRKTAPNRYGWRDDLPVISEVHALYGETVEVPPR